MAQLAPEAAEVFARLNELVRVSDDPAEVYDAVVRATVRLVDGCDRAAILVKDRGRLKAAAATDDVARSIDELEIAIGDGPCLDAILEESMQFDPDLTEPAAWPELAAMVVERTPVRGMIGCRLTIDGRKVGALDLFSDTAGALTQDSVDQAAIFASLASACLSAASAQDDSRHLERALGNAREIGKAIGLLMAAHKVDDEQAFRILQKTSQELNIKLSAVAGEIVRGQAAQAHRH